MNKIATSIFGTLALLGSASVVSTTGLNKLVFPVKEKEITTIIDSKEKASLDNFCGEFWDYAEHNPAAVGTLAALGLGALGLGAIRIMNRNNKFGKQFVRYEYSSDGQIIHRLNFNEAGVVESVTRYKNGKECETVQLYTNVSNYNNPDERFDIIIDSVKQNSTGDCWLLNGLSLLSKKPWGRTALREAISVSKATGDITVKFKHAYGRTKKFVITPRELDKAKKEKIKKYSFKLNKGTKVYIDGKLELLMPRDDKFIFDSGMVRDNITFVNKDGGVYVWSKSMLNNSKLYSEDYKYSSGDLTVIAIEMAVERSRREAGGSLEGGELDDVIALFTDIDQTTTYINTDINMEEEDDELLTNTEKDEDILLERAKERLYSHIDMQVEEVNKAYMKKILNMIDDNFEKYTCEIGLKMDGGGLHAAQIIGFESKNGDRYIVYTHPWNDKAYVSEEINKFVSDTLHDIVIVENDNYPSVVEITKNIGNFKMCNKSNKTNLAAAIYSLGQDPDYKPNIEGNYKNYVVSIKGTKIIITPTELATAMQSECCSDENPNVILLEIAVEKYINKIKHKNTISSLNNTNIETIELQEILGLLANHKLEKYTCSNIRKAYNKKGLKFAVTKRQGKKTYYAIKEIKQLPDNKYTIAVVQPEDTTIVITYTEDEFKRLFSEFEIYY